MNEPNSHDNGEVPVLVIKEFSMVFNGKTIRIKTEDVIQAFEKAPVTYIMGPNARYYVSYDGDLKPVQDIFHELVPESVGKINIETAELVSFVFRSLGFNVLDRRSHHLMR